MKKKKAKRGREGDVLESGRSCLGTPRTSFYALVKHVPFEPCCHLAEGCHPSSSEGDGMSRGVALRLRRAFHNYDRKLSNLLASSLSMTT